MTHKPPSILLEELWRQFQHAGKCPSQWPQGCGGCLEEDHQTACHWRRALTRNPRSPGLCLLFPRARRLTREEAAKALGLTSVEESATRCGLEAASVSHASVHGPSSEESAGGGPGQPSSSASQIPRPWSRWPLCIQVTMVLLLPNSLPWRPPSEQKQTEIPNLFLHVMFVGKKPATQVKKRPAAVLEAGKPPASEAASMHSL